MAEFSIAPLGHGETSIGRYVAAAIAAMKEVKGLECQITPMGTVMEADNLETILEAPRTMKDKVDAVKKYMKRI